MTQSPQPKITRIKLLELKPTQVALGMKEVEKKREQWRDIKNKNGRKFLGQHFIPVVIGPAESFYIIDHHHLCRALLEEEVEEILIQKIQNLSWLVKQEFWDYMELKRWVYPYDETGKRVDYKDLPKDITRMRDDPYRALAGQARQYGAFAKEPMPFSEYAWANFLRLRLSRNKIDKNFDKALQEAVKLCQSREARYLPGWCGRED
jgi:hypothetical protein